MILLGNFPIKIDNVETECDNSTKVLKIDSQIFQSFFQCWILLVGGFGLEYSSTTPFADPTPPSYSKTVVAKTTTTTAAATTTFEHSSDVMLPSFDEMSASTTRFLFVTRQFGYRQFGRRL
jgi:hypothetical protein